MKCEECLEDVPLTYRSVELKKKSVCVSCINKNHPSTVIGDEPGGWPLAYLDTDWSTTGGDTNNGGEGTEARPTVDPQDICDQLGPGWTYVGRSDSEGGEILFFTNSVGSAIQGWKWNSVEPPSDSVAESGTERDVFRSSGGR